MSRIAVSFFLALTVGRGVGMAQEDRAMPGHGPLSEAFAPVVGGSPALRLSVLQDAAVARDARARQSELQGRAHELRMENLSTERLPRVGAVAAFTHQSDVPTLPLAGAGGVPNAPLTRYQVGVEVDQLVYDGGALQGRESVEAARRAEIDAELRATLHPLRIEVTEAYFTALLLQTREAEIRFLLRDLEARLAEVRTRAAEGAALAGDTAAVQAEWLRAGQTLDQVAAERASALAVLSSLTNTSISDADVLEIPALAAQVTRVESGAGPASLRLRAEFDRLAALRERLDREAAVVAARARPRVRAFGQAGLGRPGPFELFDDGVNDFWMLGLRAEWQPWTWHADARDLELLRVQREIAETEEAALAARLERSVQSEVRSMRQLEDALVTDERIVALREQIERQARLQYDEGTITAPQYLDARTDVFEAREAERRHTVELARAQALYLTILGISPE